MNHDRFCKLFDSPKGDLPTTKLPLSKKPYCETPSDAEISKMGIQLSIEINHQI